MGETGPEPRVCPRVAERLGVAGSYTPDLRGKNVAVHQQTEAGRRLTETHQSQTV